MRVQTGMYEPCRSSCDDAPSLDLEHRVAQHAVVVASQQREVGDRVDLAVVRGAGSSGSPASSPAVNSIVSSRCSGSNVSLEIVGSASSMRSDDRGELRLGEVEGIERASVLLEPGRPLLDRVQPSEFCAWMCSRDHCASAWASNEYRSEECVLRRTVSTFISRSVRSVFVALYVSASTSLRDIRGCHG